MIEPTDYTAKLYLQATDAIPGVLAAAAELDFTVNPDAKCYDLVAGPIADALTKAGADCCLEDQLGLAVMMLAEVARRYTDLRDRVERGGAAPNVSDVESAYTAAMSVLTDELSEILPTLEPMAAHRLGMAVGGMALAAHATGRREAFAEAQTAILREAQRGEHNAPPRVRLTYTGGLRRASKVIEPLLGKAMDDEVQQRSRTTGSNPGGAS